MPIHLASHRLPSQPPTLTQRFWGIGFAAVWLLLWSLFTLAFDGFIVFMVARTMLAWSYPSVPGAITHSEVRRDAGLDGDTFRADLKYDFQVNGRNFTGDHHTFINTNWSSSREPTRIVRSLPVGQRVDVFYNPRDPQEAALDRTLDGMPLFLALFVTPFNLIMVGGWRWAMRKFHGLRDLPIRREGDLWVVRRAHGNPLAVTFGVAGAISLVGVFVIGFAEWSASLSVMSSVWLFLIVMSLLAYRHTRATARSEPPVLIVDAASRTVTWPAKDASQSDLTIAASQLRAVELDATPIPDHDTETIPDYSVLLTFTAADGQPSKRLVLKTTDGTEAELLSDWLNEYAGGACSASSH